MPYRPLYRPLPPSTALSEHPAHSRLQLAWVAQPRSDRSVEVLVVRTRGWIPEVVAVRDVEDLDQGLKPAAQTRRERPRDSDVPREILILLADGIPQQDVTVAADALRLARRTNAARLVPDALLGRWLGRVVTHPAIQVETSDLREHPTIDAVPLV